MEILFCHDGSVKRDLKNRYYSIGYNDKLFGRYDKIFEEVAFVTRVSNTSEESSFLEMNRLSPEKYRVIEYPNYLNIRGIFKSKKRSNLLLESEIKNCDGLIVRLPSFLGSKCIKIAKKYNKPVLVEVVGCSFDSLRNHGLSGKILAPYMFLLTKKQVMDAKYVLYVTKTFLQKRYPTKGKQIACSDVDLKDAGKVEHKVKTRSNVMQITTMGTIGKIDLKYKGHKTVLKAMSILKKEGIRLQYQVVGPGDKKKLEKLAIKLDLADDIVFVGTKKHEDIFEWLRGLDIYIQPSLTEGLPRSVIEAMSQSCPCIASNVGGIPELLDNRFLFTKNNARELAEIIRNSDVNGLFEQGSVNKEVSQRYSEKELKEKREQFYKDYYFFVKENMSN